MVSVSLNFVAFLSNNFFQYCIVVFKLFMHTAMKSIFELSTEFKFLKCINERESNPPPKTQMFVHSMSSSQRRPIAAEQMAAVLYRIRKKT